MPKTQRPTKAALARLARLPRRPDLVIEGGKRPLGVFIRDNDQTVQPQLALWLDAQSGFIRSTAMINPLESTDGGIGEALAALVDAATNPVVAPLAEPPPGSDGAARTGGKPPVRLQPPPPGLPARIVVDDAALAEAARAIFTPLDVPVEVSEQLPAFEEALDSVAPYLGARPDAEPPQPFSWEIDAALLPALYKAAATYARRAPWQYMPDNPPVAVRLGANGPEPGMDTLYASIMGGGGQVIGIALYYSLDDYRSAARRGTEIAGRDEDVEEAIDLLRQAGAPVDQMEPGDLRDLVGVMKQTGPGQAEPPEVFENSLVFFLEEQDESDPTYLEWLAAHGLKYTRHNVPFFLRTAAGSKPRQPDEREVRALTLAIEALARFFKEFERVLQGPFLPVEGLRYQATVQNYADKVAVDVQFPPENYDWDEDLADEWDGDEDDGLDEEDEPEQPGSPAGQATVYRFLVKLAWKKAVWRRIDVRGDQTLHDLHRAIQRAFDWDDDHLYAFFLSGKAWDGQSEYASPFGDGRSASRYRLEQLSLQSGQQFLYIFDFGDELRHLIKLEAITPGAVQAGAQYPRITERHGESVPQYGDEDEEE